MPGYVSIGPENQIYNATPKIISKRFGNCGPKKINFKQEGGVTAAIKVILKNVFSEKSSVWSVKQFPKCVDIKSPTSVLPPLKKNIKFLFFLDPEAGGVRNLDSSIFGASAIIISRLGHNLSFSDPPRCLRPLPPLFSPQNEPCARPPNRSQQRAGTHPHNFVFLGCPQLSGELEPVGHFCWEPWNN